MAQKGSQCPVPGLFSFCFVALGKEKKEVLQMVAATGVEIEKITRPGNVNLQGRSNADGVASGPPDSCLQCSFLSPERAREVLPRRRRCCLVMYFSWKQAACLSALPSRGVFGDRVKKKHLLGSPEHLSRHAGQRT